MALHEPGSPEIIDANETLCDMVGHDRDRLLELALEDITADVDRYSQATAERILERVPSADEPVVIEWPLETRDGAVRWIEVTLTTAEIHGEERIVSAGREITDRKARERDLRAAETAYEDIFHSVTDAISVHHPETGEILDVNDSYVTLFGYDRKKILELNVDGLSVTDAGYTHERGADIIREVVETGEPIRGFEWLVERADGKRRWLEVNSTTATVDGEERVLGISRDVTNRKRRERTLETLHDATSELTAADSKEAACRIALDAAESVLELRVVGVYLHDDASGLLELTAATDHLEEAAGEVRRTIEPGSGQVWEAFIEGESVRGPEDPTTGAVFPASAQLELLISLGHHGLLLVGASDEDIDAEDAELARILSVTLEAALNHVTGERRLEVRERELAAQTERIERLDRLNTLVRRIEQATVEHSTREQVERAVCNDLVAVEPYDLSWIVEVDLAADTLVMQTTADFAGGSIVSQPIPLDETVGPTHPAATAFRDRTVAVADNLIKLGGNAPWRKRALAHGYQSCCAVPLCYEEVVHGVLVILSKQPGAFLPREQEVLGELGRSIGFAIDALRRKRALESDVTVAVEFDVANSSLPFVRLATTVDGTVTLERTIRRADGSVSAFYAVESADTDAVDTLTEAGRLDSVIDARRIADGRDGDLLELRTEEWWGRPFTERGGLVSTASADSDDARLVVELPRTADVRDVVEAFKERYPEAVLVARREDEGSQLTVKELQAALEARLTERQREVVETAFAAGYFEWPRERSGQEIAELLEITQPTFNKHLRLAERKAFALLLNGD